MQGQKIQEQIYTMARPLVEAKGLELVDVEFVKEGANWYLRLYIDKETGVDLEDCQNVSRAVSDLLDEKDPIAQSYFLEVSSPGIERVLRTDKDFVKFKNSIVRVATFGPVEGQKLFKGYLGEVDSQHLRLKTAKEEEIMIPRQAIAQVRLAWDE